MMSARREKNLELLLLSSKLTPWPQSSQPQQITFTQHIMAAPMMLRFVSLKLDYLRFDQILKSYRYFSSTNMEQWF